MKTGYHPEMQETARQDALFRCFFCLNKVSITWKAERDEEARAAIKKARCRPSKIEFHPAGTWSVFRGIDSYSAMITLDAYDKLNNTDMEMLLD